jgi:hypothetical protein
MYVWVVRGDGVLIGRPAASCWGPYPNQPINQPPPTDRPPQKKLSPRDLNHKSDRRQRRAARGAQHGRGAHHREGGRVHNPPAAADHVGRDVTHEGAQEEGGLE